MDPSQMAARIAELESELVDKDGELQATRQQLRNAQDEIRAKDIQLLARHKTLQVQVEHLSKRPTLAEHETVQKSLEKAEFWSRYWKDQHTGLVDRPPLAADVEEGLQGVIATQKRHIEQLDVSLDDANKRGLKLQIELAQMVEDRARYSTKEGKRRDLEKARLNAYLNSAHGYTQSALAEQEKCVGRIRALQNGNELLQAQLAISKHKLQCTQDYFGELCTKQTAKIEEFEMQAHRAALAEASKLALSLMCTRLTFQGDKRRLR
jgi:hypothetical protein